MKIQQCTVILVILVLMAACGVQANPSIEPSPSSTAPTNQGTSGSEIETSVATETSVPPAETVGPNCLGDEVNPVGKSIADEYEFVSYEQVMTWFCNGAEFEDILVALETEAQTGTPADEMLKMLADGYTWDEIWQTIGLMD